MELKKHFRDVVEFIDYYDLLKMKKDLETGGMHMLKLIDEKIKEYQKQHHTFCAFCSSDIDPNNVNTYTLLFGPDDFKKKATFCGIDCMESFTKRLKEIKTTK